MIPGDVSGVGVKLDPLSLFSLGCSAGLEVGVRGRVAVMGLEREVQA